ncbi:hypothetical protein ACHAQH_003694 [Verticillium albo-atrum]
MIFSIGRARVAKHQGESPSTPSALSAAERKTFQMSFDQESDSDRESSIEANNYALPRAGPAAHDQAVAETFPDQSDSESVESTHIVASLPRYGDEDLAFQSQESGDESDKSDYTPPVLRTFSSLNPPSYSDDDEDDEEEDEEDEDGEELNGDMPNGDWLNNDELNGRVAIGNNMLQASRYQHIADKDLNYTLTPVPPPHELPQPIYSSEDEDRPPDKYAILAALSKESTPEPGNGFYGEDTGAPTSAQQQQDLDDMIKRSSPTTPLSLLRKATKRKLSHTEKERRADKRRRTEADQAAPGSASSSDDVLRTNGNAPDMSTPSTPGLGGDSVAELTPTRQKNKQSTAPAFTPQGLTPSAIDVQHSSNEDDGNELIAAPVVASTPASQKRKQQAKPTFALASQRKPLRTYRTKSSSIRSDPYVDDDAEGSSSGSGSTGGDHAVSPVLEASTQSTKQAKLPLSTQKKKGPISSQTVMGHGNGNTRNGDANRGSTSTPSKPKQTPKSNRKLKKRDSQPTTPATPQNPLNRVFNKDDLLRITKAVEDFGTQHKLTRVEINDMIQERFGTGRHSFNEVLDTLWNTIFTVCPGKTRQKTIDYCRKNFHNFKARGGNWTADEDEELALLVEQNGKQWTKLSKELNRHPEDIRDRYRNYVICGDNLERSNWTDEEERMLLRFVDGAREALRGPMRTRPVESTIDWQKISEQFDRSRSRLQCLTKWKRLQA